MTTYSDAAQRHAAKDFRQGELRYNQACYDFDAGVAHQEEECTTRGHFGAVTVPAEPITTAAELDALPMYAVVLDSNGHAWQKMTALTWAQVDSEARVKALHLRGPLTPLAPVPATTEPERLTDPDDPRIKVGAVVTVLFKQDDDNAITYRVRIGGSNPRGTVAWVRNCVGHEDVYLLAEAPDPRADLRAALRQAIDDATVAAELSDTEADDIIDGLIDRNYNLTKRAE